MGVQLQGPGGEEGERRKEKALEVHELFSDAFHRKVKREHS